MFSFENLEVYKRSLILTKEVMITTSKWNIKYQSSLADQLRRASLSIPLNIAEGTSKSRKDFKRFLGIARGSTYECIPIIDISSQLGLITGNKKNIWYNELVVLAKMLSKLRSSI